MYHMSNLNLPQTLIDLDESLLPDDVREKISHLVKLGYRREHMMVNAVGDVHISEELAMLHATDEINDNE